VLQGTAFSKLKPRSEICELEKGIKMDECGSGIANERSATAVGDVMSEAEWAGCGASMMRYSARNGVQQGSKVRSEHPCNVTLWCELVECYGSDRLDMRMVDGWPGMAPSFFPQYATKHVHAVWRMLISIWARFISPFRNIIPNPS
jgi:hypothetical protein